MQVVYSLPLSCAVRFLKIQTAATECKCKPQVQVYFRKRVMWDMAGKLLQLPKELNIFPCMKAYLKSQRIASRVNEEESSTLPIKYRKAADSDATIDTAWLDHEGKIHPVLR